MRALNFAVGLICIGGAFVLANPAGAATLMPADVSGGYSGDYLAPTQIGVGYTSIMGGGSGGQTKQFALTGLPSGAQTLTFTFSIPATVGVQSAANNWAYANGGGTLLYSIGAPLAYSAWGGTALGNFGVSNSSLSQMTQTLTLSLGSDFSGSLYLGLNFTYGSGIDFAISAPSNAIVLQPPVAAVPVPAGVLTLGAALAGLGLASRRRRRTPAAA